jgi:hypothetical protein
VQLALPSDSKATYVSRLMIAGMAVAGASLFAMTAPTPTGPLVQQRDVKLAAGELDWSTVISDTEANLADLQTDAAKGSTDLSTALGNVSEHFGTQITDALTGFESGIQNSLYGGWYGSDDGYVFGLLGGTVTNPATGISETNSLIGLLSADFQAGNSEQAYSDVNAYMLEVTDHTLRPLLSPLVDETSDSGVTTNSIPVELSQIQTSLLQTFGDYNELKDGLQSVLSPEITAQLVLTKDLDTISADFTAGDTTQGMSDLNNLSSDVFGALINGADVGTNPVDGSPQFFSGLLGDGSLLQHLVLTWPEQFVTALGTLGESTTSLTADAVGSSVPDLFTGLLSF